jgi:Dyp-type peroxidase family
MNATSQSQSKALQLDEIQGNSLGGFNKDNQAMLFLRITDAAKAKATLSGSSNVLADVTDSSSEQVIRFNNQFKALRSRGVPEGTILASWTNLVFTFAGLRKLRADNLKDGDFPEAFTQGMRNRADQLGDNANNAPDKWDPLVDWENIDAVLIVASDDKTQVDPAAANSRLAAYITAINTPESGLEFAIKAGANVPVTPFQAPGQIYGRTRVDQPGHEHFGFKDGVSQPGVRGIDPPDDTVANPDQGQPGQDLLHPGEFIIGYPRQRPGAKKHHDGPNPDPGIISGSGQFYTNGNGADGRDAIDPFGSRVKLPDWTRNGSFVVFRRLKQDVAAFSDFIDQTAGQLNLSPDLFGAKLVGRYKSGAPLEPRTFAGSSAAPDAHVTDPGEVNPALGNDNTVNNNFEYGDDPDGNFVPRASHIRKVYPRDQVPDAEFGLPADVGDDAESRTQTHRILRRGIPYGESLGAPGPGGAPNADRGLLFICYQSDLERQFEFVQKNWVDDRNFPAEGAGLDALISNKLPGSIDGCPFHPAGKASACPVTIPSFIVTRGGEYFFAPSISALTDMLKAG